MPVDLQELSREGLLAVVAQRDVVIGLLTEQVAQLVAEIAELKRRLDLNSSNSSRPPSSDGPYAGQRPRPKDSALRGRSGRKPGKQPGAPGKTLRQVDIPDEIVVCQPDRCQCGHSLADADVFGVQKRQVFDVTEPPPPRVTEYQVIAKTCPSCHEVTTGVTPGQVSGRVQFGAGVHARGVLATIGHMLPYGRAARLLRDLSGVKVSVGFLVAARRRAVVLLTGFMARVKALLRNAGVLHVDETPAKVDGDWRYLHVARTGEFTAMHVGGRTNADIDAGGILDGYTGTIMRDGYSGYAHLIDALHAWCGAHLLRDLKAVHDADPGQRGVKAMSDTLLLALSDTHAARTSGFDTIDPDRLALLHSAYHGAIATIRADNHPGQTPWQRKALTLADRFTKHEEMILRFLHNLAVPFTNNMAERDVRGVKIKQRTGGSWRTIEGLADFAIIWSYLSTAAKHGLEHLDVLTQLFTTGPWLPPQPTQ